MVITDTYYRYSKRVSIGDYLATQKGIGNVRTESLCVKTISLDSASSKGLIDETTMAGGSARVHLTLPGPSTFWAIYRFCGCFTGGRVPSDPPRCVAAAPPPITQHHPLLIVFMPCKVLSVLKCKF